MREVILRWGNRVFETLVIAAVIWSTAALGAAWGWGIAVTFGLCSAAFCIWVGMRLLNGGDLPNGSGEASDKNRDSSRSDSSDSQLAPPLRIKSPMTSIMLCALAAYVVLQVIPLPVSLVKALSPVGTAQELRFGEALGEPAPATLPVAVDCNTSQRALVLVAVSIMGLGAGAYLAANRTRVRRVMQIFIVLALLEALYGLAEDLSGHQYVLWIPAEGNVARGTFFNRNHFAATLALFLPVMIGWFYFRASAAKSRHEHTHLLPATSWDILGSKQGLWLLPPAILVVGIIESQSRGGFSAMILATALMFAVGSQSRAARAVAWLGLPLALALFTYGLNSDYQAVLDRFGELTKHPNEGRTTIWKDSLGILRDYPLFGVGLGNFPRVYMQYASVGTLDYPYMAHNEWLEGLVTLGGVGMGLAVVALVGFFIKTFYRIRHAGPDFPWLLGCWCGLLGLAFHSFGEFNLHIPSITLTASIMVGILLGFNMASRARGQSRDSEKRGTQPHQGWKKVPGIARPAKKLQFSSPHEPPCADKKEESAAAAPLPPRQPAP